MGNDPSLVSSRSRRARLWCHLQLKALYMSVQRIISPPSTSVNTPNRQIPMPPITLRTTLCSVASNPSPTDARTASVRLLLVLIISSLTSIVACACIESNCRLSVPREPGGAHVFLRLCLGSIVSPQTLMSREKVVCICSTTNLSGLNARYIRRCHLNAAWLGQRLDVRGHLKCMNGSGA